MKVKIFLAVLLGMACNTATAEAEKQVTMKYNELFLFDMQKSQMTALVT